MTTRTITSWLNRINQPAEWLEPKLSKISDQTLILDRSVFIERLAKAIRSGEHVVVYGDYDVDGSTACVILTEAIRYMGGRVTPVLASRFLGGYGFSDPACDKVMALRPSVVITCDCGGSDHPRIQRLKDAGIDTLVLDHHVVPDTPLPATAFLNPNRPECPSNYKAMCSGALAWSVVGGLKRLLGSDIDTNQYLELAAIATICDVAPLTEDNRAITRAGLALLPSTKRLGLKELLRIGKLTDTKKITGRDIGFRIGPQINAPGRLTHPDIVVQLLLTKDPEEAKALGAQIEELSTRRREITTAITDECVKQVEQNNYHLDSAIVVGDESYNHGIVGIVAARLVDKYGVPAVVIGSEGRGSLRGPVGTRLYDALVESKDTLIKYGGHQAAAGCQIDWHNLTSFRSKFCQSICNQHLTKVDRTAELLITPDPKDPLLKVCDELYLLEPCGQGNPRPVITFTGNVKETRVMKEKHLKLIIGLPTGGSLTCFGAGMGEKQISLHNGNTVVVQGDLRRNEWNGRVSAELFLSSIHERELKVP